MALQNAHHTERVARPIRKTWWKESSVYQVYPASFKDTSGNGRGDLQGIISQLDYIKNLGVDVVWLSPILKSPQVDMGYDISDYKDIDPLYGTMDDHDALIRGLHEKGLKYVMDLVVNHSSDEHPWFIDSRSSKQSAKRDWYIWRPARYDVPGFEGQRMPPNNWECSFTGSAWEWDEHTQEYYLHLFAKEQPDLNWENPEVVRAVHDIIRFWLDRGVDGFRMDVINFISKAHGFPDAPVKRPGFLQNALCRFACGPRLHEFFQGIGEILREYNAFSVGEMPGVTDTNEILKAVGQDRGELAMAFQFEIVELDGGPEHKFVPRKFQVSELKKVVNKWQTFMLENGGWNALYMENHDQGRTISRYTSDSPEHRAVCSKMLATHLVLQSGTPFVYQGQELAMINVPRDWPISKYQDIECLQYWAQLLQDYPDDKERQATTLAQFRQISRDNARTPMQWTPDSPAAGFSPLHAAAAPWMSVHPDYEQWNAANQVNKADSPYNYWRTVLRLRKQYLDIFVYGNFHMVDMPHPSVVAYLRTADEKDHDTSTRTNATLQATKRTGDSPKSALVVTSFSETAIDWTVPEMHLPFLLKSHVALGNYPDAANLSGAETTSHVNIDAQNGTIKLRPFEALVLMA